MTEGFDATRRGVLALVNRIEHSIVRHRFQDCAWWPFAGLSANDDQIVAFRGVAEGRRTGGSKFDLVLSLMERLKLDLDQLNGLGGADDNGSPATGGLGGGLIAWFLPCCAPACRSRKASLNLCARSGWKSLRDSARCRVGAGADFAAAFTGGSVGAAG